MASSTTSAALFTAFSELTAERIEGLTALDAASGDGDFGENLQSGLATVELDTQDSERSGFASAAKVFLDDVGGTSGPLFGLLFQEIANAETETSTLTESLRVGLPRGLAAIQRVGGAEAGDRTMVDALSPAVEVISSPEMTLQDAAASAIDGAGRSADLVARRGRTSYVGQRAVGFADPGAVGVALFLLSALEVEGQDPSLLGRLDALFPSGII